MPRYAVVDAAGNVINIVEWDGASDWRRPAGVQAVQTDIAGLGWTYLAGQFTPPPPPPPDIRPPDDIARDTAFLNDLDRQDIVSRVKTATPDQIRTWIMSNVTDLPTARVLLIKLALLVARLTRA